MRIPFVLQGLDHVDHREALCCELLKDEQTPQLWLCPCSVDFVTVVEVCEPDEDDFGILKSVTSTDVSWMEVGDAEVSIQ